MTPSNDLPDIYKLRVYTEYGLYGVKYSIIPRT